jgi:HAD superfamily hydrolase (TIGR01509 family)
MIKALIFDFDGLILDTETPEYDTWQTIYREHGHLLAVERWGQIVGGYGRSNFDPGQHLCDLTGRALDVDALKERMRRDSLALIHQSLPRPGVLEYLETARQFGLRLAIASSSSHAWVDAHLARLDLLARFDRVICQEDVGPGRTKPHPDLFLAALAALKVSAAEAIVFEDSPNGVLAAHRAGIFAVAVPNPLTSQLTFVHESLRLASMQDLTLPEVLARADGR